MKVFVALALIIGSVCGRGSGPYLPSGWRPEGPAFYLPSEVTKPAPAPVVLSVFPETEASGSDALREYGPPKLEESVSVNQGLPEVATAQTFAEVKNEEVAVAVEEAAVEENAQRNAAVVEVSTATESQTAELVQAVEEQTVELSNVDSTAVVQTLDAVQQADDVSTVQTEQLQELAPTAVAVEDIVIPTNAAVEELVLNVDQQEVFSTVSNQEINVPTIIEENVVPTIAADQETVVLDNVEDTVVPTSVDVPAGVVEQIVVPVAVEEVVVPLSQQELVQDAVPTPVQVKVENVAAGVNNIAEALVNLEKEVKAAEIQAIENTAEISTIQESSGLLQQAPEGFLEYGPPGFLEYGPPKQEDLARLAVEVASVSALENNEVRRRRFSPKFRSSKTH